MSRITMGIAFDIADLLAVQSWATRNQVGMEIQLDHGLDDEDYEEVIAIHTGSKACLLLMWRNQDVVFVQPLPGRRLRFPSVSAALDRLVVSPAEVAGP